MRKQICTFFFLILLFGSPAFGQQGSVVIVDTERTNGYGVAWGGPNNIVTPLHVVAGQKEILVRWGTKSSMATVEKIYKQADLALLKLETPMDLPTMQLFPSDPFFGVNMNYWEVTASLESERLPPPARRNTELEERTHLKDINTLLAKKNTPFDKALCKDEVADFFPGLATPVFKFAEPNIGKKHSGTPLTFQNQIVGMVDGGAKRIAGKDLVWAIPASEFLNLRDKGVRPPSTLTSCSSEALFSGLRSDNPLLSDELRARALELENAAPITTSDSKGNELVFSLDFRGTYEELFDSMFEEDQEYIQKLIRLDSDSDEPVTLRDVYWERCDILVEENSGATIAYPSGRNWITYTAGNEKLIEIQSPGGGVSMIIQVSRSASPQESKDAMDAFKAYLVSDGRNWVPTAEDDGEVLDYLDDEDPFYYQDWWREVKSGYDVLAELFATLEIDGSNFLGVAVVVEDWGQVEDDPEERKFFYLMEACTLLTGFAYY